MEDRFKRAPFNGNQRPTPEQIRKARALARKVGPRAIAMLEAKEKPEERNGSRND